MTQRREHTGDRLAIFKQKKTDVGVKLDFSVAPGSKRRAAFWKWEGGIFRIT